MNLLGSKVWLFGQRSDCNRLSSPKVRRQAVWIQQTKTASNASDASQTNLSEINLWSFICKAWIEKCALIAEIRNYVFQQFPSLCKAFGPQVSLLLNAVDPTALKTKTFKIWSWNRRPEIAASKCLNILDIRRCSERAICRILSRRTRICPANSTVQNSHFTSEFSLISSLLAVINHDQSLH